RGTTDYVQPGEDVERAVTVLAGKIRHPVLTDLELVGDGARLAEVYPVRLPDLFAGEELVVFGRSVARERRASRCAGAAPARRWPSRPSSCFLAAPRRIRGCPACGRRGSWATSSARSG